VWYICMVKNQFFMHSIKYTQINLELRMLLSCSDHRSTTSEQRALCEKTKNAPDRAVTARLEYSQLISGPQGVLQHLEHYQFLTVLSVYLKYKELKQP